MRATTELAIVAVLALAGCRGAAPRCEVESPTVVVVDLPPVQRDALFGCGLAAVSAKCQYYGLELDERGRRELIEHLETSAGPSAAQLRSALEGLGMDVFVFAGTLDRSVTGLYAHVDKGQPALVQLAEPGEPARYCLFVGYDEARERVLLVEPGGVTPMRSDQFERAWKRADRFTLLATPRVATASAGGASDEGEVLP
jgi:hypothetical protein